MTAKLLALALVIVLFVAFSTFLQPNPRRGDDTVASKIELVPAAIGDYYPVRSWKTSLARHGEEGAVFAPSSGIGDPVQLDFFRNSQRIHNGIACYLVQGESLLGEQLRTLQTVAGPIEFDVALTQAEDSVRIVASTECRAQACNEYSLSSGGFDVADIDPTVVPVSIMLTHQTRAGSEHEAEALLEQELEKAASSIDLSPARQLAASK